MDPDFGRILETIRRASPLDLFLISFVLLPFVIAGWIDVADGLGLGFAAKLATVAVVIAAYLFWLFYMVAAARRRDAHELCRQQILDYLERNKLNAVSFERLRERFSADYTDEFLVAAINSFPGQLARVTLADGRAGVRGGERDETG